MCRRKSFPSGEIDYVFPSWLIMAMVSAIPSLNALYISIKAIQIVPISGLSRKENPCGGCNSRRYRVTNLAIETQRRSEPKSIIQWRCTSPLCCACAGSGLCRASYQMGSRHQLSVDKQHDFVEHARFHPSVYRELKAPQILLFNQVFTSQFLTNINAQNTWKITLLCLTAMNRDDIRCLLSLIEAKAELDLYNKNGRTGPIRAITLNKPNIVTQRPTIEYTLSELKVVSYP